MLLRMALEAVLCVRERAEEWGGRAECGRCPRGVRKSRRYEWRAVCFGAVVGGLGIVVEMGAQAIVVAAVIIMVLDNILTCDMIRVRADDIGLFMTRKAIAGIDIIVCASAAGITDIARWETDAAVMLPRTIGTWIIAEMRRRKCRGAQVRLQSLLVCVLLVGEMGSIVMLLLLLNAIIVIIRIREIGRRESYIVIIVGFNIVVLSGHVDRIVVRRLIGGWTEMSCVEFILRHRR